MWLKLDFFFLKLIRLPSCFLPWAKVWRKKDRRHTDLFPYLDHRKYSLVYCKSVLGTEPSQAIRSCPAGLTCWMLTLQQNTTVLFPARPSHAEWLVPLSLPVAMQCTVAWANGGIPWWHVWTGSSWGYTMLPLLQQTSHPATNSCTCVGFYCLWTNRGSIIWCRRRTSPASTAAFRKT